MAIYNEILVGRFARTAQKMFGIKGSAPLKQLAGEIGCTIEIENLPVELRYLALINRFWVGMNIAAVAAQNSAIKVRNPAGSNCILVIESAKFFTNPSLTVLINRVTPAGADLGTVATPTLIDSRPGAGIGAVTRWSSANNVAIGGAAQPFISGSATQSVEAISSNNQELPLMPGDEMTFSAGNNVNLIAMFTFRERFSEESERL